ncbi:MAG: hypothetical protein QXG03_13115 [Halalkalicoccus sp.]
MRRRTALKLTTGLFGTASAACLGDGSGNGDGSNDDALYTVSVELLGKSHAEELPLVLDFDTTRETITEDDPFEIEIKLRNDGDGPVETSSGAPWPFGVVWLERADAPDEPGVTLWTDAYEESSHVRTEGRRAVMVEDIGFIEDVDGGESISETYELHGDTPELTVGTYRFSVGVGARAGEVSDSVSLDIELVVGDGSETAR